MVRKPSHRIQCNPFRRQRPQEIPQGNCTQMKILALASHLSISAIPVLKIREWVIAIQRTAPEKRSETKQASHEGIQIQGENTSRRGKGIPIVSVRHLVHQQRYEENPDYRTEGDKSPMDIGASMRNGETNSNQLKNQLRP